MAGPLPVLLTVDEDALEDVTAQLTQRYGREYRVEGLSDPTEALRALTALDEDGSEVALVLVGQSSAAAGDGKLLEHVRRLHPHAKRALLVSANAWMDDPTADAIRASMALGRIDHYIYRPAESPDEVFHEAVSDFLLEWAREQRLVPQTVHIVGEEWSGRAFELREVFRRCAVPHDFCLADSEKGRALMAKAGPDAELPVMILPDGTVLSDPSDAQIAEAAGAPMDLDERTYEVVIVGAGPGGPLRRRVRRLRRAARPRRGLRRHRRTGGVELPDPQLPRLRQGRQRQPARGRGVRAGDGLRRHLPVHAPRDGDRPLRRLVPPPPRPTGGWSAAAS